MPFCHMERFRRVSMKRWLVTLIVVMVVFLLACILTIQLNDSLLNPQPQEKDEVVQTLTMLHEDEARSAITVYFTKVGSPEFRNDTERLSEIATGYFLTQLILTAPTSSFFSFHNVNVEEVRVLEYTTDTLKVIGCGTHDIDEVTLAGDFIKSIPLRDFRGIFVFMKENRTWKLADAYDFMDINGGLRDWEYVSEQRKETIGKLPIYISQHYDCGMR